MCLVAADRLFPPDLARYRSRSTEILSRDGRLLSAFPAAGGVWRLATRPGDVDPRYLALLLEAEDRHFRAHRGIDPGALLRAAWQFATVGRIVSGGSTLTMQTARLLEPHPRSLIGKLHDMARALQLERRYGKDEILGMYLTLAPFGGNIEGVRAASLAWFGHPADRLSTIEAGLLVVIPQAPAHRRPDRHPAQAMRAARRLLARLGQDGRMPPARVGAARYAMPRSAGFFCAGLARQGAPGSVLTSTIDAQLQAALDGLLAREMSGIDPAVGVAALVVDNRSRAILASVGGRGEGFPGAALDLTETRRSPGSALKPFLYGMAFDAGMLHPLTLIPDAPGLLAGYAPRNFDLQFHGAVTAETALRQSYNIPAVEVLSRVGPGRFVAGLRQAGARIALPGNRPNLAVALGGLGISLHDMVKLYAALGDDGTSATLAGLVTTAAVRTPFLGPLAVFYLQDILVRSPPPPGMAYAELTGSRQVAFKTGTSFGFRDAWAVGYSGRATIGVWTGRVEGTPRPGAFGRAAAAPLMLAAFGLLPPEPARVLPLPAAAIAATTTAALPAGLRRFDRPAGEAGSRPVLEFPPQDASVDLLPAPQGGFMPVQLRAAGGAAPFRWLINGVPVPGRDPVLQWQPDGPGPAHVTVIDRADHASATDFRLVAADR